MKQKPAERWWSGGEGGEGPAFQRCYWHANVDTPSHQEAQLSVTQQFLYSPNFPCYVTEEKRDSENRVQWEHGRETYRDAQRTRGRRVPNHLIKSQLREKKFQKAMIKKRRRERQDWREIEKERQKQKLKIYSKRNIDIFLKLVIYFGSFYFLNQFIWLMSQHA